MRKRIAIVHKEKCHPHECGEYTCGKLCPVNRMGADCITPSYANKAQIDEILCTGCAICTKRCPFGAIEIINLPTHLNKPPLHRYGENSFELYSLPTPLFGKVTGIIGKNAIGKTTAMKILSNLLQPNLGKLNSEVSSQDIINYFKGSETQKFFEKIYHHLISVSYKPQQVDLIPHQYSGLVRDLLAKVDPNFLEHDVVKKLSLTYFIETPISEISGGELQRVALAAAVLRKANLYLFDEPTSFLDIKQRIAASHLIRSLANDQTTTIVVEHDLVILDYMTDMVNIMYGHDNAFGIVSGVKSTREGINSFLDGYLKEENVRFRDYAIKFQKISDSNTSLPFSLISWGNLSAQLGQFKLKTTPGHLYKNEVVGILGENGIGKTSFIKILAGLIKPKEGMINCEVKVAYKPQYLDSSSNLSVGEFLQRAIEKYDHQLIRPLDLERLFTQKISQLSGGQLQKVAIAHCFSQDAQLFLLDEPSAYLDIEQRLLISKIIKNITQERNLTVLVVDHDLMFLDYLSDRLIVFTGKPAQEGLLQGPFSMEDGMNLFLKELNITLRRDLSSHRPRINKEGSVKDREQREKNKWYYS